jgi:hypothetical protein
MSDDEGETGLSLAMYFKYGRPLIETKPSKRLVDITMYLREQ